MLSRNALDRAAHASVAALTGGLSPTSVALAFMDWACTWQSRLGGCWSFQARPYWRAPRTCSNDSCRLRL
ncbi:poly-beta-hydroxybutyrate polymerase N-terminal domain-containing protein [Paraburkholderia sp. LEh10]|uniref:poly-beta-hydroxybutyrate polymerase N-terminal domain-containing protein n=1 Tax=Paraburkholderia sp. LEh10 TaxID=2821353 RepID=UPI0028AADED8|nr:poly-beta-hydroxybutyrate polymerase N-terminal domain-containing protein [Paraburkholderia sp. LEh10]